MRKLTDVLLGAGMLGIQIAQGRTKVEDFIKWKDKIIKEGVKLDEKQS